MTKLVLIIDGATEAKVFNKMTCPKLAAYLAFIAHEFGASEIYFGSATTAPHKVNHFEPSMN